MKYYISDEEKEDIDKMLDEMLGASDEESDEDEEEIDYDQEEEEDE